MEIAFNQRYPWNSRAGSRARCAQHAWRSPLKQPYIEGAALVWCLSYASSAQFVILVEQSGDRRWLQLQSHVARAAASNAAAEAAEEREMPRYARCPGWYCRKPACSSRGEHSVVGSMAFAAGSWQCAAELAPTLSRAQ